MRRGERKNPAATAAGSVGWPPSCKRPVDGGGGNRTRVPRRFCGSFYVCSRLFESCAPAPNRQGPRRASRERSLATGVLDMASREPDLTTDF